MRTTQAGKLCHQHPGLGPTSAPYSFGKMPLPKTTYPVVVTEGHAIESEGQLLKLTRAVRPDGCSRARTPPRMMSTQRRPWHTRFFSQCPARSHASARNMPKVHHANVSTSAKTWVLCVQEWFLSSRDRLKKSRVLARATCECSSRAHRASHSPTARVLCNSTAPRCSHTHQKVAQHGLPACCWWRQWRRWQWCRR